MYLSRLFLCCIIFHVFELKEWLALSPRAMMTFNDANIGEHMGQDWQKIFPYNAEKISSNLDHLHMLTYANFCMSTDHAMPSDVKRSYFSKPSQGPGRMSPQNSGYSRGQDSSQYEELLQFYATAEWLDKFFCNKRHAFQLDHTNFEWVHWG